MKIESKGYYSSQIPSYSFTHRLQRTPTCASFYIMTSRILFSLAAPCVAFFLSQAASFSAEEEKKELPELVVEPVTSSASLMKTALAEGKPDSYVLLSESLDGSITAALSDTRKFRVIRVRPEGRPIPNVRQVRLEAKLDDFQDFERRANLPGLGEVIIKRTLRIGIIGSLYDLRTGELLASSAIRLSENETRIEEIARPVEGAQSRELITKISDDAARQLVTRTLDCLSPHRIIAKTGNQITFNRGKDFGYPLGQLLDVFAVGEPLKDPETGSSLGQEEILVGTARVRRVNNRVSTAVVLDDHGIDKMCVIRPATPTSKDFVE